MSRILIADDDKILQRVYKKILEYLGHDFVLCDNGLQAVENVKKASFDLIILDFNMPEMSGCQACEEIRKLPEGISIPIIIVSAEDSQEEITSCFNAGANDYMMKPVKEPVLVAKLKNFLKISSLHKNELELVKTKATVADRYKIMKILGYGSHSVVFLAEDTQNDNKKVSLKMLNQNVVSEELISSFVETAEKLKNADLENIVEIIDFGQYNGHIFAVLEFADGGDFAAKLKQQSSFTEKEIIKLLLDLSKALISLDNNNILHLDIKPENILLSGDTYKLADFGVIQQESSSTIPLNAEIWSTASFAAPETFMNPEKVSVKSDIYSLGVTLYRAITGDNPFDAVKPSVSMYRQINLVPTSLLDLEGNTSVELALLVDMMLAKNPEQRPTPDELQTTATYLENSLSDDKKLLTYIDYLTPKLEKNTEEEELKKNRDMTTAANNLKDEAKIKVHIKDPGVPVSKQKIQGITWKANIFTKAAVTLIAFFIMYYAAGFIRDMFVSAPPKYDFQGIPAEVMCEECGNIEVQPVIDIHDNRCSKCGGHVWYTYKCNHCGKKFPWNEDSLKDDNIEDTDKLEEIYVCPYCHSPDIEQINP